MNDAPQTEPMTVGQLIENLSGYPADAVVLVNCGPGRPFQSPGTTEIYFYEDDNNVGLRGVPADDTGSAG
jgi:hypothetical protein